MSGFDPSPTCGILQPSETATLTVASGDAIQCKTPCFPVGILDPAGALSSVLSENLRDDADRELEDGPAADAGTSVGPKSPLHPQRPMLPVRPVDFLSSHQHQPPIVRHPPNWPASPLQFLQQLVDFPGRTVEMEFNDDHCIGEPT